VADDGWWLRADDGGVVRRANAVFAAAAGAGPLAAKIARAEAWYGARGAPTRFQLSPASAPAGLAAALNDRGYRFETSVLVMTRTLGRAAGAEAGDEPRPEPLPSAAWLRAYAATLPAEDVGPRSRLAFAAPAPKAYVAVADVACGMAVLDGRWVGLFDVATDPLERRRGHAGRVTGALLRWAAGAGAEGAYLQVAESNLGARALYAAWGFRPAYGYRYAVRPDQ
jgi:N-acetylglutamate synthase